MIAPCLWPKNEPITSIDESPEDFPELGFITCVLSVLVLPVVSIVLLLIELDEFTEVVSGLGSGSDLGSEAMASL